MRTKLHAIISANFGVQWKRRRRGRSLGRVTMLRPAMPRIISLFPACEALGRKTANSGRSVKLTTRPNQVQRSRKCRDVPAHRHIFHDAVLWEKPRNLASCSYRCRPLEPLSHEKRAGCRLDMLRVGAPRAGAPVLVPVRSRIGLRPVSLQWTGEGKTKTVPVGGRAADRCSGSRDRTLSSDGSAGVCLIC